ncbi:putative disease resistance RPP13-like protein 1 isoform X1 [Cannabis sativa]|uniref:putative disease resistance RPP13-like protein 1 isoform X1 n=1 Tax=Cannabis sativa TaxID=3483 RepID=UPI0029CA6930|nr:putative disease resistance RPP13-like protein 1 isoform X1 [Cannabis sativa]
MADLMVGGALLSGFINVLFDRIASKEVLDYFRGRKHIQKLLKQLETTLLSANVLLDDAEDKQLGDSNVKKWLEDLKEVIYEADHVVDKISTEALRLKMEKDESESIASKFLNLVPTMFSSFDNAVKSELEEILASLDHLIAQKECLGLKKVSHKTTTVHRSPAPLLHDSKIYGREGDKENIVKLLLSDGDDFGGHKISVVSIVGMGGIGKTTLAQSVYYDTNVQEHFDLKAWVTVSDDFDVFKLTKVILEAITKTTCGAREQHQLQNDLQNALTGKKFFIVLDDVWNENYLLWDSLKSSFEFGQQGSKIIVTTRNKDIALMMKTPNVEPYELGEICDENCWKLFTEHIDTDAGSRGVHPDMDEIGKQIVKKCKGLPLAVKSMAGLLRSMSTREEWKHVLQSGVWEFPNCCNIGFVPALWLSYRFLPPYLKLCFSYLSIFPKDYEFQRYDREKLILIWMAEGVLQPQKGKRIEDVGEDYLNVLMSRSFLQRSRSDEFSFTMHDLMHDLAMFVSGKCSYDNSEDLLNLTSKIRHFSYLHDSGNQVRLFESLSKVKYLRGLLSHNSNGFGDTSTVEMVLKVGECLRTLSLPRSKIVELPASIGNLKHLRYVDVSGTNIKELPTSICVLYNLETLILSSCSELIQLPANISKLINLRHLMIKGTPLKEMPPRICNMVNLQTLSDFVLCENDGPRIKELGKLENLHGDLCISGLEYVQEASDVLEGSLKSKEYLTGLVLNWDSEADNSSKAKEVLDALKPHINLKRLTIKGYSGTSLPDWVTHPSYCNLEHVALESCKNCCVLLSSFRLLSSLTNLEIEDCLHIHNDGISLNKSFVFLTHLHLKGMTMLDWSFTNADDQNGEIFPCLKVFKLNECQKLNVALPDCNFPSLESIYIRGCNDLVTIFPTSTVHIDAAYPCLEMLITESCSSLESFSEMGLPFALKNLCIVSCHMLIENRIKWNLQSHSSLKELVLYNYDGMVDSFPEEWLLPPTLTYLAIEFFESLEALNGKGFQQLTSLQNLSLFGLQKLECLPEGLPHTLTSVSIGGYPLPKTKCVPNLKIEYILRPRYIHVVFGFYDKQFMARRRRYD